MSIRSMPPYRVMCHSRDCPSEADFKIAARWSDGVTRELKTYFLACGRCLPGLYAKSLVKKRACRLTPGESIGDPEVFELIRGQRDVELVRREELERPEASTS